MVSLLLAIIYLAFISLGLPDSLLGSGWPAMQISLKAPMAYAGIVTVVISTCTIISSLFTERLTAKFGTGLVTGLSVAFTAIGLLGFSLSNKFYILCLFALPYGLGAGAVDAALNNYVAVHYRAGHMSWLHCCWCIGALISPYIMGYCITNQCQWQMGYRIVFYIQISIAFIILASIPMWKRCQSRQMNVEISAKPLGIKGALKVPGAAFIFFAFFSYCAMEATTMIWGASYMSVHHGFSQAQSAQTASLFYIGMGVGRAICGFIANKLGDKTLIRSGFAIIIIGILLLALPLDNADLGIAGLLILGFGCGPIYPSIIHSTPTIFGKEHSQGLIGMQMAFAYLGSTIMPPIFGILAQSVSMVAFAPFLFFFYLVMVVCHEMLYKKNAKTIETA